MKATKKIVGAAVALVAAVALSAGSTFAWFASNNEVTAEGMQVKASVPANLYIAKNYVAYANVNDKAIDFDDSAATILTPAAISNSATSPATGALTSGAFYVLTPDEFTTDPTTSTSGVVDTYETVANGSATSSGATITKVGSESSLNYVYKQDMTLANKGTEDIDLDLVVTLATSTTSKSLTYSFIRVGFIIGDVGDSSTTYTFTSPANDVTSSSSGASSTDYTWDGDSAKLTVELDGFIEDFAASSIKTVTFLVWFDGDDADCTVNNAADVSEFNIDLAFTAAADSD